MFLTSPSHKNGPVALRFTDIGSGPWTNGFILPTGQSGQSSDGLLEIFIQAPLSGNQPRTFKITIDEAGDSFTPKAITQVTRGDEIVYRLLNYTNLGAYQFPTKMEWAWTSYPKAAPPNLFATGSVTVISARIPDQIADSMFRLESEEKSAEVVWDWDAKSFAKSAHTDSNSNSGNQARAKIYDETSDGSKQIADALVTARKKHKHVLIQFGANWCSWCHKLHRLFETDKNVAGELKRDYVVVLIDVNNGHNQAVDKKYGNSTRFGLPALVVLDTDGKSLITQDTGALVEGDHYSPEKVMAFLKKWSPTR
jgi:thiol-disulfide isomerase/thioredoxin